MSYPITKTLYSITDQKQEILKKEFIEKIKNSWRYSDNFKKYITSDNVKCEITRELVNIKVYYNHSYIKTTKELESYNTGAYVYLDGKYCPETSSGWFEKKERVDKYGEIAEQINFKLSKETLENYTSIPIELDEKDEWAKNFKEVIGFIGRGDWGEDAQVDIESIEITCCEKIRFKVLYDGKECVTSSSFLYANDKKFDLWFCGRKNIYSKTYAKKYSGLKVVNNTLNITNGLLSVICVLALVASIYGIGDYFLSIYMVKIHSALLILGIIGGSISALIGLYVLVCTTYVKHIKPPKDDLLERVLAKKFILFLFCITLCAINFVIIYYTLLIRF